MKDSGGRELNVGDSVQICIPHCFGNGTVVKITKTTAHVLCGGELYRGILSGNISKLKS